MNAKRFCGVLVAVLIVSAVSVTIAFSADVNMKEGKWENSVEMKMEGLPFPMPPIKFKTTQCITQKDLVPNTAGKDQKCEVKEQKIVGNKVTWKVTCVDMNGTSEQEGETTYSGSTYQGAVHAKTTDKQGQTTTSAMKLSGQRVGDCK